MKYKDRKKHNTQKQISVYCQQVGEIKKELQVYIKRRGAKHIQNRIEQNSHFIVIQNIYQLESELNFGAFTHHQTVEYK